MELCTECKTARKTGPEIERHADRQKDKQRVITDERGTRERKNARLMKKDEYINEKYKINCTHIVNTIKAFPLA